MTTLKTTLAIYPWQVIGSSAPTSPFPHSKMQIDGLTTFWKFTIPMGEGKNTRGPLIGNKMLSFIHGSSATNGQIPPYNEGDRK